MFMKLFMLILFPVAALFLTKGFSKDILFPNKYAARFLGFCGLLLGTLYCAFDWIFLLPVRFAVYNFGSEFISLCISELIIPIVLCFVPLFLLFNEPFLYKLKTFTYVLFGFYTIQLPYLITIRYETLSPFLLFLRPLLQLGLCISIYCLFASFAKSCKKKSPNSILNIPIIFIMFILPTIIETAWFLGADIQIWATLSIIYLSLSFVVFPILTQPIRNSDFYKNETAEKFID